MGFFGLRRTFRGPLRAGSEDRFRNPYMLAGRICESIRGSRKRTHRAGEKTERFGEKTEQIGEQILGQKKNRGFILHGDSICKPVGGSFLHVGYGLPGRPG